MKFIKEVLLFQSKDELNIFLGIFCWLNILNGGLTIIGLITELNKSV